MAEGQRRPDFSLDLDVVRDVVAAKAPALTFLCSPNNPTGLAEDRSGVEAVLSFASGLVVVDEAYAQFSDWSALSLVDDTKPLVVTRTFSKTWSMAASRLGYLIGPPSVVAELDKVVLPYHLDVAKQLAGTLAVRHVAEMDARVAALVEERGRLTARLVDLPVEVWPSGANFVLFRPHERDGDEVWQALVERSILVRNLATFPGLAGCLRVTIGTPAEDDAFLDALTEILT